MLITKETKNLEKIKLTAGSMMISNTNSKIYGVLLYRKGPYWFYSLTSPSTSDENIMLTNIEKVKRYSIISGIKHGYVDFYLAKKKGRS